MGGKSGKEGADPGICGRTIITRDNHISHTHFYAILVHIWIVTRGFRGYCIKGALLRSSQPSSVEAKPSEVAACHQEPLASRRGSG